MTNITELDINTGFIAAPHIVNDLTVDDVNDIIIDAPEITPNVQNVMKQLPTDSYFHIEGENPDFPTLPLDASGKLIHQYIQQEGFADHHINVYDNWIFRTSYNNVYGRMLQFKDGRVVCFENLQILPPRYTRNGKVLPLSPKLAREQFVTYGSDWHVDVVLREGSCRGEILGRREGVCIGTVPVMLRSRNCMLHGKSPRELALLGEDPKDPGGYFIIEGVEKVVLLQELLSVNKIFLMNLSAKSSTVARMTANTPSGTALIELALDKSTRTVIKIRFPSMRNAKQNEKYKSVNVLRIFRIFGISDINEITHIISLFMDPKNVKKSILKLTSNIVDFITRPNDIDIIANKLMAARNGVKYNDQEKIDEVKKVLDKDLFPHLNDLPGPDGEEVQVREERIGRAKIYLLSIMIARFLEHIAGFRELDDRDSWSNKRVEGAGRQMETLFRNAWRKTLGIVQAGIESDGVRDLSNVVEKIKYSVITDTFRDSFITINWGVKGNQMKNNVAQTLIRDSLVALYSHINTVDVGISRTDRNFSLRLVQNSQYGFIDSISSSEGDNCGILKNIALTAKVSLEVSDADIIRYLIGDTQFVPRVTLDYESRGDWNDKLIVNGKFLGWCNIVETKDFLLRLRREGTLMHYVSIIQEKDWLYVDIGPSRLMRPLLIVDPDQTLAIDRLGLRNASNNDLLTSGAMEYISSWEQEYIKLATTPDKITERLNNIRDAENEYRSSVLQLDQIREGAQILIAKPVEPLLLTIEVAESLVEERLTALELARFDVKNDGTAQQLYDEAVENLERLNRGEDVFIPQEPIMEPLTEDEAFIRVKSAEENLIQARNVTPFTHCELDPVATIGLSAALIPWPDHNQAPRNTYQSGMGKQALGIYHSNHQNRLNDGTMKTLVFPNRALVETEMYSAIGLDQRGPGENAVVALMSVPDTEEDAFIFKKEFIDNGGFRIYKYLIYKTMIKHNSGEITEKLTKPERRPGEPTDRYKYIQMAEPDSPLNGLPSIGAPLKQGDCVIGKVQYIPLTKEFRNESVILRVGDEGVVDKVSVTTDNKVTTVVVKLRLERLVVAGDKFSPRNAQKGTIGRILPEIEMPFSENGLSPDIIVNSMCFTADTQVLLKNGLSVPLTSTLYDGGNKVWSLDKSIYKFVEANSMGYESKGVKDIVEVVLSDGRKIRCTPDHRFPVLEKKGNLVIRKDVPIQDVTPEMDLLATIDGVLDVPNEDEVGWTFNSGTFNLSMDTNSNRNIAMAYARLLGLLCTDGCLTKDNKSNRITGSVILGSNIDVSLVLDDVELLTGQRPKTYVSNRERYGNTFNIFLPNLLTKSYASLEGITIGRKTVQVQQWPKFIFEDNCPKVIVREFLGGLFGGDGWCPYLIVNKQDGQGSVTFSPPAFSKSAIVELKESLRDKISDVGILLKKVGVTNFRLDTPKFYTEQNGKKMVTYRLQLHRSTDFGNKVGFRYCVQKMYRMAAYQSYMKYLENIKNQNDYITRRASEIYDNKEVGKSLMKALEKARSELFVTEKPFNEYYSYATLDQVRNRRRSDRFNEIKKWDYTQIDDAKSYLERIGAYHWFGTEESTSGADYIINREDNSMPYFSLKLHSIRPLGQEEVYDLGIHITHTLVVSGVAALNCIPTRMTMSYPMEQFASKHAAMRCTRVNGGAFKPFEMEKCRETMRHYGMNEFGYEKMRSGNSGKELDALIFMAPTFFQALKHHVLDKIQVRSLGQVKPMTRQPPPGRGNRGGLKYGEMERDASISHGASSLLRERLMLASDAYQAIFCKTCGHFGVYNAQLMVYKPCRLCGDTNYGRCVIPYAYKYLTHLLAAPGINLRPEFISSEDHLERVFKHRDITQTDDPEAYIEEEDLDAEQMALDEEDFDDTGDYGHFDE